MTNGMVTLPIVSAKDSSPAQFLTEFRTRSACAARHACEAVVRPAAAFVYRRRWRRTSSAHGELDDTVQVCVLGFDAAIHAFDNLLEERRSHMSSNGAEGLVEHSSITGGTGSVPGRPRLPSHPRYVVHNVCQALQLHSTLSTPRIVTQCPGNEQTNGYSPGSVGALKASTVDSPGVQEPRREEHVR